MEKNPSKASLSVKQIVLLSLGTILLALVIFNIDAFSCTKLSTAVFSDFGTFYGGVVGTIVAFVGIYFIYKTFEIQTKTIVIQESQFDIVKKDADFNIINKMYESLISEIDSVQIRALYPLDNQVFRGIDAFYNYESSRPNNAVLNHLQSILIAFEHLLMLAETKVRYKYDDQKKITLTRIYFLYYEKIIWPVYEKLYKVERELLLKSKHPGTAELFEKYEVLTKRTYDFLLEHKYVGWPSEELIADILERNS
ncbi:MAG: hypothetical protein V4708_11455 [Bacteroidota bacterium]